MSGGGRLGQISPAVRGELEAEVVRRLEPFRAGEEYQLSAHIRVLTARKPS
jgi:hypothetical protein